MSKYPSEIRLRSGFIGIDAVSTAISLFMRYKLLKIRSRLKSRVPSGSMKIGFSVGNCSHYSDTLSPIIYRTWNIYAKYITQFTYQSLLIVNIGWIYRQPKKIVISVCIDRWQKRYGVDFWPKSLSMTRIRWADR